MRSTRGKSVRMPQPTLPLMVNLAGMIPLIFAGAILQFPAIVASYFVRSQTVWVSQLSTSIQNFFNPTGTSSWGYWVLYFLMVVTFTYFYTTVIFEQQNYGDNLKTLGRSDPGCAQRRRNTKISKPHSKPDHFAWRLAAGVGCDHAVPAAVDFASCLG